MSNVKPNTQRIITEERVISGFFREALFQNRIISFDSNATQKTFFILDIEESSTRGSEARHLILQPLDSDFSPTGSDGHFKCLLPRFLASWQGQVETTTNGTIRTLLPTTIEIKNARRNSRNDILSQARIHVPVYVYCDGLHCEATLDIEDISQDGIGGLLRIIPEISIRPTATINGYHVTASGTLRIAGEVVRAEAIEGVQAKRNQLQNVHEKVYRIGIKQYHSQQQSPNHRNNDNHTEPLTETKERRRAVRHAADMTLSFTSPLNPNHTIDVRIDNISISGFCCRLLNQADENLLPIGCGVHLKEFALQAEIVSIDQQNYRFHLINGDSESRTRWLKMIAQFQHPTISTSLSTATELIELFCESGAFYSAYLKNNRNRSNQLIEGFVGPQAEASWLHRWVERTPEGKIRGHISAARFGDNLWYVGDIAGMLTSDRRISRNYVSTFCKNFYEYCIHSSPCPQILIGWQVGHPYWKDSETLIHKTLQPQLYRTVMTSYHRLQATPRTTTATNNQWNFSQIHSYDYRKINSLKSLLPDAERSLLDSFDFDIGTFESPRLHELFLKIKHKFRRAYVVIENAGADGKKYLLVVHAFPLGSSPNQNLNIPWLVQLGDIANKSIVPKSLPQLIPEISRWGIANGFHFPGVLEVKSKCHLDQTSAQPGIKLMKWYLGHPTLLPCLRQKP